MRKLTDKRKSVSMMVLNAPSDHDDEENDTVHPLPSTPGRRRSVFGLLSQPKQPTKEKRRFSISTAFLGSHPPANKESSFFYVPKKKDSSAIVTIRGRSKSRSRAKKLLASISVEANNNQIYKDNEVDYLPGLPPISDEVPISLGFADGWENRIIFRNSKSAVGRKLTSEKESVEYMGRAMRVVVAGARRVGKTAILKQVACVEDITHQSYDPTIDDTYQVLLEEADRPREILIFHDTGGIPDYGPVELKKAYLQVADAFVLVYSVTDHESFNRVDLLRKFIEQHHSKEKKEVPIVVLGNMRDLGNRKVDPDFAQAWAAKAKVKLFEVTAKDRNSLVDFVHYLGQRHFHPIKESKFSLSKKLKSEKSNAAILMDF